LTNHLPRSTNAARAHALTAQRRARADPINAMARLISSFENMSHLRRTGAKCP
jgi:hypothetical protein